MFKSLHGQTEVEAADLGMAIADGEIVVLTDEQAAIAFSNPNFVDAETGINPNFTCATCKKTTHVTALLERHKIAHGQGPHTSTMIDGKRYCEDCLPLAAAQSLESDVVTIAGGPHDVAEADEEN
jgi:hypothetical protein